MPVSNERVHQLLEGIASVYELVFPGRIRSIYIEGSYAANAQVPTSDMDLTVIFKDDFANEAEPAKAYQLCDDLDQISPLALDITMMAEASFAKTGLTPMLKLSSRLLAGQDIRADYELIPIDRWARDRMHATYWLMNDVFPRQAVSGNSPVASQPRDYPDPQDPFFGYTRRMVRLPDGREVPCTRDLIRITGWGATALLAYQAGQYVANKRECAVLYRQHIQDGWASFHEQIYNDCRTRWNYLIPESAADQQALRDLCLATLGFEKHFLAVYQQFVLQELRSGVLERSGQALWVLDQIPYADAEIEAEVLSIGNTIPHIQP